MDHEFTSLLAWFKHCVKLEPRITFTQETGAGESYGDVGDITAHVSGGPYGDARDMQSDVVGVWLMAEKHGYAL
tara:strand:- start:87 stop:308 length:222 start_codon:yes stop_codon:yes gene_type:complete